MKYRDLLESLQQLTENQLEQDVVFCPEERAWRVSKLEVLSKPLYYDEDDPDMGCFELDLGDNEDDYQLAYPTGYPLLVE